MLPGRISRSNPIDCAWGRQVTESPTFEATHNTVCADSKGQRATKGFGADSHLPCAKPVVLHHVDRNQGPGAAKPGQAVHSNDARGGVYNVEKLPDDVSGRYSAVVKFEIKVLKALVREFSPIVTTGLVKAHDSRDLQQEEC